MNRLRKTGIAAALFALSLSGAALAQGAVDTSVSNETFTPTVGQSGKDVIWVPTPEALVERMLDMAELTAGDTLVDLGSGDGRTVITAAKRGAKARGIEYNPDMVALSKSAALQAGVADRAVFEQADIFESDFSDADVVTLFLLPGLNLKLKPILLDMKPGTRVVSNSFTMGDWEPDETGKAEGCTNYCVAYKWIVPAKVDGRWKTADGELVLSQNFQFVEGTLNKGGETLPITDGRLTGDRIEFKAGDASYAARVSGAKMEGEAGGKTGWSANRSGG
jgi:SAM-dependent methyltransferase